MYAAYDEGSTELRSLEPDDIDGLCAIYPPGRSGKCDPKPRGGQGDACLQEHEDDGDGGGCAVAASPGSVTAGSPAGGPPGKVNVTVDLMPGDYALLCVTYNPLSRQLHSQHGMIRALRVTQ